MLSSGKRSKKTNFIFCIISSAVLSIGFGSILVLGNFNVYIASYIHDQEGQKYVNLQYGNLMVPLLTFAMTCFTPISGPIEKKIGPKLTIILGEIIISVFLIFFYIQKNIWFTYFICFGVGFGYSIVNMIPVKNLCFYYPKYKGLISTSIPGIGIISSGIFNIVGEIIINPEGETAEGGFYSKEIGENHKKIFLYILFLSIICTIICIVFFVKYDPSFETIEVQNQNQNETDNNTKIIKDENYYYNLKKIFKNYRIWLIAAFGAFASFSVGFVLNTFRAFVSLTQTDKGDGEIIQYLGAFIILCLCVFAPLWGFLSDKFGFRIVIVIITFLGIIDSVGLSFFLDQKIMYRILICLGGIIMSGLIASIGPHVMGVFGIKYALELNGIVGIFSGIISLAGAITSFIFGVKWENPKDIIEPYRVVFIIGSILNILAFILQWFEPVLEFNFGELEEILKEITDGENNKNKEENQILVSSNDINYS